MSIQNELLTNTQNLDLGALITKYGPPHYTTKRNPVGTLNEVFWAAFFATLNEILYENKEDQFYKYKWPDGHYPDGIFVPCSKYLLQQQLASDIMSASETWPGYGGLDQLRNTKHLAGAFSHFKGFTQREAIFSQQRNYIHVRNGVIDLSRKRPKLIAFSPHLISRNSIPIDYKRRARCPEFVAKLLAPLTKEDIEVLQKLVGMFLGGVNFLQKILILQGAPGSGKSALAAVIRLLVGDANCTELRTAHLEKRFEIARLMGKMLLIGADVAGDFLNQPGAHVLKKMTGGDWVGMERKYSNEDLAVLGVFCVLITCNSRLTVRLDGDRGAWLRRLIILNYEQKKHIVDIPGFAQKLVAREGSGILNWGLEGLEKANADVKAYGTILLSPEQQKRSEMLLDESEGLRTFVTENIISHSSRDLTTEEIVQEYAVYCGDPDRGWNLNVHFVQRQLPNLMMTLFQAPLDTHLSRNGTKQRGYRRVTFKP